MFFSGIELLARKNFSKLQVVYSQCAQICEQGIIIPIEIHALHGLLVMYRISNKDQNCWYSVIFTLANAIEAVCYLILFSYEDV